MCVCPFVLCAVSGIHPMGEGQSAMLHKNLPGVNQLMRSFCQLIVKGRDLDADDKGTCH